MRLLHPVLPFVTEEIYGKLPQRCAEGAATRSDVLMTADYPVYRAERIDEAASSRFNALQEIVRLIRALRAECGIDPQLKLRIVLYTEQDVPASAAAEKADLIKMLAGLADIRFINDLSDKPAHAVGTVGSGFEAFLVTGEEVDCSLLIARFSKELEKEKAAEARLTAKLANANFTAHAPAEVVNSEKEKLQQAERRSEKFTLYLQELGRQ